MTLPHLGGFRLRLLVLALDAGEPLLLPRLDLRKALLEQGGAAGRDEIGTGHWLGSTAGVRIGPRRKFGDGEVGFVEAVEADGLVRLERLDLGYFEDCLGAIR